ncbi:MAG: hypothetical protein ACLRWQ_08185 [Flavonifractor plautii]
MGMNAVILQVRPSADALYPSELYPWSQIPDRRSPALAPHEDGFDPLAYWVESGLHALGLELHARDRNPFRLTKSGQRRELRRPDRRATLPSTTPTGWWSARATTTSNPGPPGGAGVHRDSGGGGAGPQL